MGVTILRGTAAIGATIRRHGRDYKIVGREISRDFYVLVPADTPLLRVSGEEIARELQA